MDEVRTQWCRRWAFITKIKQQHKLPLGGKTGTRQRLGKTGLDKTGQDTSRVKR